NAALLAIEILAMGDECLSEKLKKMKTEMEQGVALKDKELQNKL
ncbi:MAG: 5-(carboxyamino)imidazole ribonucleotide mutase, partial [Clostridiales bacterium]|nr:5-(carboxyamino)imidazole ribonucleotide mutase [Clostridiales bacterium]